MRVSDCLPIDVTITITTLTMIIMITVVCNHSRNHSCSLCNWTDNKTYYVFHDKPVWH